MSGVVERGGKGEVAKRKSAARLSRLLSEPLLAPPAEAAKPKDKEEEGEKKKSPRRSVRGSLSKLMSIADLKKAL